MFWNGKRLPLISSSFTSTSMFLLPLCHLYGWRISYHTMAALPQARLAPRFWTILPLSCWQPSHSSAPWQAAGPVCSPSAVTRKSGSVLTPVYSSWSHSRDHLTKAVRLHLSTWIFWVFFRQSQKRNKWEKSSWWRASSAGKYFCKSRFWKKSPPSWLSSSKVGYRRQNEQKICTLCLLIYLFIKELLSKNSFVFSCTENSIVFITQHPPIP